MEKSKELGEYAKPKRDIRPDGYSLDDIRDEGYCSGPDDTCQWQPKSLEAQTWEQGRRAGRAGMAQTKR